MGAAINFSINQSINQSMLIVKAKTLDEGAPDRFDPLAIDP